MKIKIAVLLCVVSIFSFSMLSAQNVNIIPQPREVIEQNKGFTLNAEVPIVSTFESKETALLLKEYLNEAFGFKPEVKNTKNRTLQAI